MNKIFTVWVATTFLLLSAYSLKAQQKRAFSSEKVVVDEQVFLPYNKGEVEKKIEGEFAPYFERIAAIIQQEACFSTPQGVKILFSAQAQTLEIYVMPYTFQEGEVLAESGAFLTISVNLPKLLVGLPICPNAYYEPTKTGTFHGNTVYSNGDNEVTVLTKFASPLFVAMNRDDFLTNMIIQEEKSELENQTSDNNELLVQMEESYQQLLKIDKSEAEKFKHDIEEFKRNMSNGNNSISDQLKEEQRTMLSGEKQKQAFYSVGAIEHFNMISGLVPVGKENFGEAIIKINPKLESLCASKNVQLITLKWDLISCCSPAHFKGEPMGYNLANSVLTKLYNNTEIWRQIVNSF